MKMKQTVWSATESITGMIENAGSNVSLETTSALTTALTIHSEQFYYGEVLSALYLAVSIVGILANATVLAVLVLAHRQHGSSVNTLIANQCAIDLFACISVATSRVVILADGVAYRGDHLVDNVVCIAAGSGLFSHIAGLAEKLGLVVITLERYFKIVHAVAHRKYYRDWMTKVGVALPWIGGVGCVLFPAMGTTRVVDGRCLRAAVWPNVAMAKVKL